MRGSVVAQRSVVVGHALALAGATAALAISLSFMGELGIGRTRNECWSAGDDDRRPET
jgi:hypothetical protein